MTIAPHPDARYRHENSEWQTGTAGTFAVVIGVSHYRHLDGGATSYLLPSLHTSALTAHRMFAWLEDHYRAPVLDGGVSAPLARCWFLASPTPEECAAAGELEDAVDASMANCERVIGEWDAAMRALSAEAAMRSTLFFFFSGHGLEIHRHKQVLLPSDYLAPPARNVNKAIGTDYLYTGVGDLKVARQIFFIDACRNDVDDLRTKNPEGERILNQPQSRELNPERTLLAFHATASGQQTFQPRDPKDGPSIFGLALLEGLRGSGGIALERSGDAYTVNASPLTTFLKSRTGQLLRERGSNARSFVRLDPENFEDLSITSLAAPIAGVKRGLPLEFSTASTVPALHDSVATQYPVTTEEHWTPGAGQEEAGHRLFGSEQLTAMFDDAVLVDLHGRATASSTLTIEGVDRDAESRFLRVRLAVPSGADYWLRLDGPGGSFSFALPAATEQRVHFELELEVERDNSGVRFLRDASAALTTSEDSWWLGQAAELWQTYRDTSPAEARQRLNAGLLERLLHDKLESPLSAAIAGMVLADTGQLRYMHDWARNLANWFDTPEGPVLWAFQLDQQAGEVRRYEQKTGRYEVTDHERAVPWLLTLEQRGLPRLNGLIGMLASVLERIPPSDVEATEVASLQRLREAVRTALRYLRPGGLFTAFHSPDASLLTPGLLRYS